MVDNNTQNYIIIPLLPGDPRIQYEELDRIVEDINSDNVVDMAAGDEFIQFFIELPAEAYRQIKQIK